MIFSRARTYIAVLVAVRIFFTAGPAHADVFERITQENVSGGLAERSDPCAVITVENPVTGNTFIFLPVTRLYPPYAADPFRVGFGIQPVHVARGTIPETSDSRVNLRAGSEIVLIHSHPAGRPELGWQFSLIGGINDQNDVGHQLDNIGWDGRYGLLFTTTADNEVAFKLGLLHVSSHLGDEYIERTGRLRMRYTRQEVAAGASWFMTGRLRLYAEGGRAVTMSNDELQEPLRAQLGCEYESAPRFWKGRVGWYAALDSQTFEERDWRVDVSAQTGFVLRSGGRTWRFGVEWYQGRPPVGEFFQYTERYLSFGIWIDS